MKKVSIKKFSHAEVDQKDAVFGFLKIPAKHELIRAEGEDLEVSDGYHTFDELYDHRITLYIALCRAIQDFEYHGDARNHGKEFNHKRVWRSKKHSDGTMFDGWFVMGIGRETGEQITYHLPLSSWDETEFAETRDYAPKWDGHTPQDVLTRLKELKR